MKPKRSAKPTLGRLEKINPSDYWQSEETDFTPWLTEAENLQLLGEAVGLELEFLSAHHDDEDADVDLLCRDLDSDDLILVENQLTSTDTAHLGKLLLLASRLQVQGIVWVASQFEAEHLEALAWLNQIAAGQVQFFAVEIELWRIGKTAMAANFNPVCLPEDEAAAESDLAEDDSTEATAPTTDPDSEPDSEPEPEPLTPEQQQNFDFWTQLSAALDKRGSVVKPGAPTAENAMGFAIARAGFRLYATIDREHTCLYAELHLSGEDAHPHFYLLAAEQDRIEAELGFPLVWDEGADVQVCSIFCELADADIDQIDRWSDYIGWLCDRLERFYEVFFERIKFLDAAMYQPQPDYGFNPLTDRDPLILPNPDYSRNQ